MLSVKLRFIANFENVFANHALTPHFILFKDISLLSSAQKYFIASFRNGILSD